MKIINERIEAKMAVVTMEFTLTELDRLLDYYIKYHSDPKPDHTSEESIINWSVNDILIKTMEAQNGR